jgi:hypothetical protein
MFARFVCSCFVLAALYFLTMAIMMQQWTYVVLFVLLGATMSTVKDYLKKT